MSKDFKRMSVEEVALFTSNQVTSAIKSCRSSRTYGPDSQHIPLEEPRTPSYRTPPITLQLLHYVFPSIWKTSLLIPIPKPDKDSSQGTSYRPISLLFPAAKVLEVLILPSINEFL